MSRTRIAMAKVNGGRRQVAFPDCDPPGVFPRHYFRPGVTECGCRTLRRPLVDVAEVTLFQPNHAAARLSEPSR